jgi:dihydroorotate dehydrogenase
MDPERAHEKMTALLGLAQSMPMGPSLVSWSLGKPPSGLEVDALGLRFPNPIGLAAGFDKDCTLGRILPALGFGFLELGSVTLRPQPGNPRPRIFRLPETSALINSLGFNSRGAVVASEHLSKLGKPHIPLGINLGLNADCPREQAPREYAQAFQILEPYGDYFAVNVSSPNTQGLRELQAPPALEKILAALKAQNRNAKPILVKLSPDLSDEQLSETLATVRNSAAGIIASNTTLSREGLSHKVSKIPGGLSGTPLKNKATTLIRKIYRLTGGQLPIIGTGGIASGQDAFEKIRAGASLVQIYTGLVYHGPGTVQKILSELAEILAASGFHSVSEAVGSDDRRPAA